MLGYFKGLELGSEQFFMNIGKMFDGQETIFCHKYYVSNP